MNTIRAFALTALAVILAGCQTNPPLKQQECPVVEALVCPVYEVVQCPEPKVVEAVITQCEAQPQIQVAKVAEVARIAEPKRYTSIGGIEWAFIEPGNVALEARIDTGAETSSIHAEDIQLIEKDGKRWVRFSLTHPETNVKIPLERRLHRRILVKQTAGDVEDRRYVVRMWVTLGESRAWLDVGLSDREGFEFPLLIGRNMLMDTFVVDISQRHTLPKPVPGREAQ
jgi:hypothetical protein